MTAIYRIVDSEFATAEAAFNGRGGARYSARWHRAGTGIRIVYGAESIALATLEKLVHLGSDEDLASLRFFIASLSDNAIEKPDISAFQKGWDDAFPGPASQDFGCKWLAEKRSIALRVPSVVVPEWNYILNPNHPQFQVSVNIEGPLPIRWDNRLRGLMPS